MFYLASTSPRRAELMRQAGFAFEAVASSVPETRAPGERAADYVMRVASDKALAVVDRLRSDKRPAHPVIGADTEVVLGDEILGKPHDRVHAIEMLRRLSGRTHEVLSAVVVYAGGARHEALSRSRVTFAPLSQTQIEGYWASGEPAGKAGGYAIQGRAACFIERLEGSYSGVVGLPLFELSRLLERVYTS